MSTLIRQRGALAKALAILLVVMSMCWASWLLREAWGSLSTRHTVFQWPLVAAGFLVLMVSMALAFPSFAAMVTAVTGRRPNVRELAKLYFLSQMMKHLPGRFFGVAYQAMSAPHIATPIEWAGVNAAYMLLSLGGAVGASMVALALIDRVDAWFAVASLGTLVGAALLLGRLPPSAPATASRWRRGAAATVRAIRSLGHGRAALSILAWYCASWIAYFAAWALLGIGSGEGAQVGIELCALYTFSWVVGFVTLVTPSGLGIRELAFATFAAGFAPGLIAYVAIMARLGLLLADISFGLICLAWRPVR